LNRAVATSAKPDRSGKVEILIATAQWWPDVGGGLSRVATDLAYALADRGHSLTVIAPTANELPAHETHDSLTVHRVLPRGHLPATIGDVVFGRRFGRRLSAQSEIVIAHGPSPALGVARALPQLPLLLVYHAPTEAELEIEMRSADMPWRRRARALALAKLTGEIERRAVSRATAIVVLSDFVRAALEARHQFQGRVFQIPGGVDARRFAPADDRGLVRRRLGLMPEDALIFTARRLQPRMGLANLIRAVAILRNECRLVLRIAGDGPLAPSLRRLITQLGLDDCVQLLGLVPDDELRDWYRAADVFVLPTVELEGFGMVTVEALACGTPVVGTPVGATPELLTPLDPRLLAESSAPSDIAAAIRRTLQMPEDGFRERCRKYAMERFSWEVVAKQWEDVVMTVRGTTMPSRSR